MNIFTKINWEVRLRNKTFWAAILAGLLMMLKTALAARGINIPYEQLSTAIDAVLSILVAMGVIIDPTTKGVADSKLAMTYVKPH